MGENEMNGVGKTIMMEGREEWKRMRVGRGEMAKNQKNGLLEREEFKREEQNEEGIV